MCSKKIRNLILCFGFMLGLHAEENTAQENTTEENVIKENPPKDAPILLEEKRAQTLEFEEKEAKKNIDKKSLLEEIHKKKRQLYMLKGELHEKNESILFQQMAKNKSGFFIGVILGDIGINANPYEKFELLSNIQASPLLYGLRSGYQKYFANGISALRFYGEYLGGAMKGFKSDSLASYQTASLNIDLLMDKPIDKEKRFALGIFGGVGVGWNGMYQNLKEIRGYSQPNAFGLVLNLGVSMTLNLKHRFELALKMPPLKETSQTFLYYFKSTNIYYISYNYLL
ncbi:outer membrane beta-barrel protein [Helicobacter pylori]|uniref:outer membrane beta-barrel protein n=1 Tax=Helicobacter pylori TaxID=210 RepID=UPI0013F442A8|nr:outer membrane beta-barrel protein [Helicobacter pylori]NHB27082.1 outer membrane beta-barrel protein [Helicobacter pylori]NHB40589.1 outer membrane beta-barrel protein [Helicobacter pylori]NHB49862.1 outer membrane beta-barrel protein [Helicobacter pylori]NHB55236.1 outer membrane beta-barrel protein [Helicobacter pylori]WRG21541.1 outer membrane beta-barrel protein [Helicobacter pylori]